MKLSYFPCVLLLVIGFSAGCRGVHTNNTSPKNNTNSIIGVSVNKGPIAQTAIVTINVAQINDVHSNQLVSIQVPEEKLRKFLIDQQTPSIQVGSQKTLTVNEEKFIIDIQKPNANLPHYKLDQKGGITIKIPYCVLSKASLSIIVGGNTFPIHLPVDERSKVQLRFDDKTNLFNIMNPRVAGTKTKP